MPVFHPSPSIPPDEDVIIWPARPMPFQKRQLEHQLADDDVLRWPSVYPEEVVRVAKARYKSGWMSKARYRALVKEAQAARYANRHQGA